MNKNRTIFRRSILIFEDVCCFTGHRYLPADRLGEIKKRLEAESEACLRQGVILFETGGALGFDTMAAHTVLRLREGYAVRLRLVLPCPEQAKLWKKRTSWYGGRSGSGRTRPSPSPLTISAAVCTGATAGWWSTAADASAAWAGKPAAPPIPAAMRGRGACRWSTSGPDQARSFRLNSTYR